MGLFFKVLSPFGCFKVDVDLGYVAVTIFVGFED